MLVAPPVMGRSQLVDPRTRPLSSDAQWIINKVSTTFVAYLTEGSLEEGEIDVGEPSISSSHIYTDQYDSSFINDGSISEESEESEVLVEMPASLAYRAASPVGIA